MVRRHKAGLIVFSSFAAIGCLSANASTPNVRVTFGKVAAGENLRIQAYYSYWDRPVGEFYYTLYSDYSKETVVYRSSTYKVKMKDADSPWEFDGSLYRSYLTHTAGMCLEASFVTKADSWIAYSYWTSNSTLYFQGDLEGAKEYVNPEPNSTVTIRRIYSYGLGQTLGFAGDSYYFGEWKKDVSYGRQYHAINLPSCTLGYRDACGDSVDMGGSAALYIYTDPTNWDMGTVFVDKGRLVRVVPLNVNYLGKEIINGKYYRMYAPSLTSAYTVDQYNLKMYSASSGKSGPTYFNSSDLFIPIRNGKESKTYQFSINWFNLSDYGDNVTMDFSINLSSNLFGNCEDSQYCIGLG